MKNKCKFAAGEKLGLRSAIWSIDINKNDIYISTNHFSKDTKVSLHESGDGQWSYLSSVWKNYNKPNKERHITKWDSEKTSGLNATNIFRIKIPHTELRSYSDVPKKGVKWVSGLISGTYQFDLCVAPASDMNPCEGRDDLPHLVLDTIQLENKKWLVIFYQASKGLIMVETKKSILSEMKEKGVDMNGNRDMALFGNGPDGVPTIIECVNSINQVERSGIVKILR